jgi:hypothetical protein
VRSPRSRCSCIAALPLPIPVPIALGLHIDARVLAFTRAVATAAAAGRSRAGDAATRMNLVADLKGDRPSDSAGGRWTLRDGLVVLQTAVTLVLLVAAGLLTRSILQAQRVRSASARAASRPSARSSA